MKTIKTFFAASCIAVASLAGTSTASASETSVPKCDSVAQDSTPLVSWGIGVDLVSKYIWRGSVQSRTPGIQPTVKATVGNFTLGTWGSYQLNDDNSETDLFATYTLPFGISTTVNDYFFFAPKDHTTPSYTPDYFDYKKAHYIEGLLSIAVPNTGLTISGGKIFYGADSTKSVYTEAAYQFSEFKVFVGAGNGMIYTSDQKFKVCNIGLCATKTITITDKFSIPLSGMFIVNPDKKQAHIVLLMSF